MPVAISSGNWLAANVALMLVLAFVHVLVMVILAGVIAMALANRKPLDEAKREIPPELE